MVYFRKFIYMEVYSVNMTKFPNQEGLNRALNIYRSAMRSFIFSRLRQIKNVEDIVIDSLEDARKFDRVNEIERILLQSNRNIESVIDINDFPHLVSKNWANAFEGILNDDKTFRNQLWLIVECRNADWAHPPEGDAESESTRAHLFLIADVLGKINKQDARDEVKGIRDQLFSHEVEKHVADVSDQLETARAENAELEKLLNDKSDRLKEVEAERIVCDERLTDKSNLLESMEAENTELKKRLSETENRLKTVESESDERIEHIKTLSEQLINNATRLEAKEETLLTLSHQLKTVAAENADLKKRFKTIPDQSQVEKAERAAYQKGHRAASKESIAVKMEKAELEDRLEIASTGLEDTKTELLVWKERHTRVLKQLKVVEAKKNELEKHLAETPEPLPPDVDTPDFISFQGTTFTRHLDKYHVAGNDITQSFWDYWRECKREMRDAGWSAKKINGVWEVVISLEDFEAWIAEDDEPLAQPIRLSDERVALPTGKEMEQPVLEFLSDTEEHRRVEIIDFLTEHFSLTDDQRRYLSKTGQMEKYLMNRDLIERVRKGYYGITVDGLEVLRRRRADEDSVISNEGYAENSSYSENTVRSPISQRKWRRPGAVAALSDPAEIREAEVKIAKILNPREKTRLERELREAKRSVDSS